MKNKEAEKIIKTFQGQQKLLAGDEWLFEKFAFFCANTKKKKNTEVFPHIGK